MGAAVHAAGKTSKSGSGSRSLGSLPDAVGPHNKIGNCFSMLSIMFFINKINKYFVKTHNDILK